MEHVFDFTSIYCTSHYYTKALMSRFLTEQEYVAHRKSHEQ